MSCVHNWSQKREISDGLFCPIIFQWRWNFDFVFVAFRVERIHLRELKLETTKIADIPRSVVVRELFVIGARRPSEGHIRKSENSLMK